MKQMSLSHSNRGMALMEIMIGFGILSIVSLGVATVVVQSNREQLKTEVLNDLNSKGAEIQMVLSGAKSCQASLAPYINGANWSALTRAEGLSLNTFSLPMLNGHLSQIASVGQIYGKMTVRELKLRVGNSLGSAQMNGQPHTRYRASLELRSDNLDESIFGLAGQTNKTFPLVIAVADSNRQLASCYQDQDNSGTLQATCESLGGRFIASTSTQASRCTALDPINEGLAQEVQDRIQAIQQLTSQLDTGVLNSNQQIRNMSNTFTDLIQNQANRASQLSSQLNQTISQLAAIDQNLVTTIRNLSSTNQSVADTSRLLIQTTNDLQSRLDQLLSRFNQLQSDLSAYRDNLTRARDLMNQAQQLMSQNEIGQQQTTGQLDRTGSQISGDLAPQLADLEMRINGLNSTIPSLESLSFNLQNQIQSFRVRLDQLNYCPLGRNQYGNCVEPRPLGPQPAVNDNSCLGGNCTF